MVNKEICLQILAALRYFHNSYFWEVKEKINNNIEWNIKDEDIISYTEKEPVATYNLSKLIDSNEYINLMEYIKEIDERLFIIVSNIFNDKEKEYKLKIFKEENTRGYFNSLPEIGEEEILEALSNGWVINKMDVQGNPQSIESDEIYSGTLMEGSIATAKLDSKVLSKIIDQVCNGKVDINSKGIRLRQIVIYGELNINYFKLKVPLYFQGCYFTNWISADYFEVPMLEFYECDFLAVDKYCASWAFIASNIKVDSKLRFLNCRNLGKIFIPGAEIGNFYLEKPTDISICTVFSSVKINELYIPKQIEGENFYVALDRSTEIERLTGEYDDILSWLKNSQIDGGVWDKFADAYENAGNPEKAIDLRIAFKKYQNSKDFRGNKRNLINRFLVWIGLDVTVKFFHKPFRAIYFLVVNFLLTWILASIFYTNFLISPLAGYKFNDLWIVDNCSIITWGFIYAIDLVFYPVNLNQVDTLWPSNIYLALIFSIIKASSLIYLGLFLAGVSKLVDTRNK